MIIGTGIDIVEITRIAETYAKFGQRFLAHILHPQEIAALPKQTSAYLASRFAAKEACVKALGTGFAYGITPAQIEVQTNAEGKPLLLLHGAALQKAKDLGAQIFHLSISHERDLAIAMVILEC